MSRMSALAHRIESPRGVSHILGMGALVTILLLAMLVPRTIPVVIFERGTDIVTTDDYVEMSVSARKVRLCDPVLPVVREFERAGETVLLYRAEIKGASGRWFETTVEFVDDQTPASSRTPNLFERIDFDRWRFAYPRRMTKPPIAARLPMSHLCGEHREIAVRTVMTFPIRRALFRE